MQINKFFAQYIGKLINKIYWHYYFIWFIFKKNNIIFFSVRATLGLLVIGTLKLYRDALQSIFGLQFTKWFVAITVTQYHFMYYLSRTLPNIMTMPLGNLSSSYYIYFI